MKAKEVLKILQVNRVTLCRYVKTGKIKVRLLINGDYDYDSDSVYKLAGITEKRSAVIYARVSTQKQSKSLETQINTIKEYANANGYIIDKIYSDIASGLHFDRKNFKDLLHDIINHKIKTVFIENKDRLSRISFDMWKELFSEYNCELVVLNTDNPNSNDEKEIFLDIISILHSFSMKVYSARRKKKLNIIKEDLENEIECN